MNQTRTRWLGLRCRPVRRTPLKKALA
jgi:hypothetical protein